MTGPKCVLYIGGSTVCIWLLCCYAGKGEENRSETLATAEEGSRCGCHGAGDCVVGNQTHQQYLSLQPPLPLLPVSYH